MLPCPFYSIRPPHFVFNTRITLSLRNTVFVLVYVIKLSFLWNLQRRKHYNKTWDSPRESARENVATHPYIWNTCAASALVAICWRNCCFDTKHASDNSTLIHKLLRFVGTSLLWPPVPPGPHFRRFRGYLCAFPTTGHPLSREKWQTILRAFPHNIYPLSMDFSPIDPPPYRIFYLFTPLENIMVTPCLYLLFYFLSSGSRNMCM